MLRRGDPSGKALVLSSAAVVLKRWKAESMSGYEVEQRLRMAA